MRLIYLLLFLTIGCSTTNKLDFLDRIEDIGLIKEVPYLPILSGDSLYWEVVKGGLDIIPFLIEIIPDTSTTQATVPNFGGNYAVGDIAYFCLSDIIKNISTSEFIPQKEIDNGFWYYWKFVRERKENRILLQQRVNSWYKNNKKHLIWKEDKRKQKVSKNWPFKSNTHPAGGYYVLKKE